jgi:Holliday junction resolvase RusA-like endonuclease
MGVHISLNEAVKLGLVEPERQKHKHLTTIGKVSPIRKKNVQQPADNQAVSAREALIILPGRPTTKKNSLIMVRGRTIPLPSKAYQRYEKQCLRNLIVYSPLRFYGSVHLCIHYWLPDRKWWPDLTGLIEASQDILEKSGIIDNDRNVVSLDGTRIMGLDKGNPRAEIAISTLEDGDNLGHEHA